MKMSSRCIALVLAGAAVFACSQGAEDATGGATLATPLSGGEIGATVAAPREGTGSGEQNAQRNEVLTEVQASLAHYRESKSEAEAQEIEARFAGTVLTLDRAHGGLVPRAEPALTPEVVVAGLTLATQRTARSLEVSAKTALGDLVWHAATHAPTAADERQLAVLTVARGYYDAIVEGGSLVVDGGVPEGGTSADSGTSPEAGAYDSGLPALPSLDWCTICKQERELTFEEKLFKRACKAGLKALSRYSQEGDEQDLYCPPSDACFPSLPMPRTGWHGRLSASDLLNGELTGSLSYGRKCGRWNIEVTTFGSGLGGSDPDYGASISFGINF